MPGFQSFFRFLHHCIGQISIRVKNDCQNFYPSRFSNSATSIKSEYKLHSIAYCVKKGNLNFSHVLEDGLLGKYLIVIPKKSKLKILQLKIVASPKTRFSGNCMSKRWAGADGSWLSACSTPSDTIILIYFYKTYKCVQAKNTGVAVLNIVWQQC